MALLPSRPSARRRPGARIAVPLVLTALAAPLAVLTPAAPAAAVTTPVITSVSDVVAQDPKEEGTGPTFVINGRGFGDTPPTITESPVFEGSADVGDSALGVWANTANLHIEDEGTFATDDIGFYHPDADVNSCYLTIGKWTDTQIIVMLDDADVFGACSAIDDDDDMRVMVWSTDDGGGYGTSPDSGWFDVGDVVPLGDRARVDAVSPANGPVGGGTFNDDGTTHVDGTITVTGDRFDEASVVWFGDGGYSGGIAVARCAAGQSPATDPCFSSSRNDELVVRPPAASADEAKGVYLSIATPGGTSHLDCATVYTCDGGVYYYQSPSVIGDIDEDFDLGYPNFSIGYKGSIDLGESSCPKSAPAGGGDKLTYSVSAKLASGKVNVKGTPYTSTNTGLDIVSSLYMPTVLTIKEAIKLDITLEGKITGCAAIPLLGGTFAGFTGGLFMMIGGSLEGSYTFRVTVNKGTITMATGYVPGGVLGAEVLAENCVNKSGKPAPCVETTHEYDTSGTVYFSPLYLDLSAKFGPFSFSANAGVSLAATVRDSSNPAKNGYEICYGGTYNIKAKLDAEVAKFDYKASGAFWGPFHLAGNNPAICPLGPIVTPLATTSVAVTAGSPTHDATGTTVTYRAAVTPSDVAGTVDFTQSKVPVASCAGVPVVDGVATCTMRYPGTAEVTVDATYSGDKTHLGNVGSIKRTIERGAQAIDFPLPATGALGATPLLTATGGGSGEQVTFAVSEASAAVCGLVTDDAGALRLEYRALGACEVTARQAGNLGYLPAAPVTRTVTVGKGEQQLVLTAPAGGTPGSSAALSATASTTPSFAVDPASAAVCAVEEADGAPVLAYLAVGACDLVVSAPEDATHQAVSRTLRIPVTTAATTLEATLGQKGLTATVTPIAPTGPGALSRRSAQAAPIGGQVRFLLDGTEEYLATVRDGVARVSLPIADGEEHVVEATYVGDANYGGSADSTSRSNPLVVSTLTSARPVSASGWYRTPVTITTTCTATSAPLAAPCPSPTTLSRSRAYPDLVRTVRATDGGVGTEVLRGLRVDVDAPRVRYVLRLEDPVPVRVRVDDRGSGLADTDTTVTRVRFRSRLIDVYVTRAVDVAGNVTVEKYRHRLPRSAE
ncbi:Ig-like domain-containing protein [Nocardioides sp.]|uniref:Ig-like domain-containing protein n=1 Tax=Nocardioides sp. TaxID=35761 RepID=UPI003517254C